MTTHQPPQRGQETLESAERPARLVPAAGIPADRASFVAQLGLTLAADGIVPEDQAPQVARVCAGLLRVAADGVAPEVAKLRAENDRLAAAVERVRALADTYASGTTVGLVRATVADELRTALDHQESR